MRISARIEPVRLILSDVDGVLTNGGITFDNQGIETKTFHVRDGMAIKLWQRAGMDFGVITARSSHIVKMRMAELGVDLVRQDAEDKLTVATRILGELELDFEQVCYVGDDLTDLSLLKRVGLAATVSDGVAEVQSVCHLTTKAAGGTGAIRELIETILKGQKRWDELVQRYAG